MMPVILRVFSTRAWNVSGVYAAGGGGWDTADADARAFGVCNQHRWSDCQNDGVSWPHLTPCWFHCGHQRGTLAQVCFWGQRRDLMRERKRFRLVTRLAWLLRDTGGPPLENGIKIRQWYFTAKRTILHVITLWTPKLAFWYCFIKRGRKLSLRVFLVC